MDVAHVGLGWLDSLGIIIWIIFVNIYFSAPGQDGQPGQDGRSGYDGQPGRDANSGQVPNAKDFCQSKLILIKYIKYLACAPSPSGLPGNPGPKVKKLIKIILNNF